MAPATTLLLLWATKPTISRHTGSNGNLRVPMSGTELAAAGPTLPTLAVVMLQELLTLQWSPSPSTLAPQNGAGPAIWEDSKMICTSSRRHRILGSTAM